MVTTVLSLAGFVFFSGISLDVDGLSKAANSFYVRSLASDQLPEQESSVKPTAAALVEPEQNRLAEQESSVEPTAAVLVEPEQERLVEQESSVEPTAAVLVEPEQERLVEQEVTGSNKSKISTENVASNVDKKASQFIDPEGISEEALFQQLFGVAMPESQPVDVNARFFLDDMYVGSIVVHSDTNFSFYKINKDKFLQHVKPKLKKKSVKALTETFLNNDMLDKVLLEQQGFDVSFSGTKQLLNIKSPTTMRGLQIIDYSYNPISDSLKSDFDTHWLSGYFDFNYYTSMVSYTEYNTSGSSSFLDIESHIGMGPVFLDSKFDKTPSGFGFDYLEFNSFLQTDQYFFRLGVLEETPIVGIQINDFFAHTLNKKYKKKPSFRFSVDEKSTMKIYVNKAVVTSKEVYPGQYKVLNFPIPAGLSEVMLEIVGENKKETKRIFRYNSPELIEPLDFDFDGRWGVYDKRNDQSFEDRFVPHRPHLFLSQRMGLFSLGKYFRNITWEADAKTNPSAQQVENTIRFGTPVGVVNAGVTDLYNRDDRFYAQRISAGVAFLMGEKSNISTWRLSLDSQTEGYRQFVPSAGSPNNSENTAKKTSLFSQALFKSWRWIPLPFSIEQRFELTETNTLLIDNQFSTALSISELMRVSFSLFYNVGRFNTGNSYGFTFSFSYNRSDQDLYPIVSNISTQSSDSKWLYNNTVPIYRADKGGMYYEFDQDNTTVSGAYSSYGLIHSVSYSTAKEGSSLGLTSVLENHLIESSLSVSNQLAGAVGKKQNRQSFGMSTSVVFVGNQFALGLPGEKQSFGIVNKNKLLNQYMIQANEMPILDFFPAVISFSADDVNNVSLQFEELPETVEITNLNLIANTQYGRGYVTTVGDKASYYLFGILVDTNDDPIALQFVEVLGKTDNEIIYGFTDQNGRFEFQTKQEQVYEIRVSNYAADPFVFKLDETLTNGKTVVNLGRIQLIRILGQ